MQHWLWLCLRLAAQRLPLQPAAQPASTPAYAALATSTAPAADL
jgi:hypothetical protein